MKKFYLILAMCIAATALAQNSFPTSNAIWNERGFYKSQYHNGVVNHVLFGLLGDTTINDVTYNKLYSLSDTLLIEKNLQEYIGAFRNEEQKVFFKPAYWTHPDILLYDFGAKEGDTVWHNAAFIYNNYYDNFYEPHYSTIFPAPHYSIISAVDTTKNVKVYFTNRPPEHFLSFLYLDFDIWYEGVGSMRSLFLPLLSDIHVVLSKLIDVLDFNLDCFKQDDTAKFIYSNCNKCFCPKNNVGILENELGVNSINIYPNPTNGKLRITNYELRITNYELRITDITGKIVFTQKLQEDTEYNIDISHLQSGMYFLKVDNQVFKIIKN